MSLFLMTKKEKRGTNANKRTLRGPWRPDPVRRKISKEVTNNHHQRHTEGKLEAALRDGQRRQVLQRGRVEAVDLEGLLVGLQGRVELPELLEGHA